MTESVDTVHKRARRPRLSGGLPARAARAVRGRVLARGPPVAAAHARGRRRVRPRARVRQRARARLAAASSATRSRERRPGSAGRRRAGRPRRPRSSARRASHVDARRATQGAHGRRRDRRSRRSSACGPGCSSRRIVVLAHRDALASPGPRRAVGHGGAARAGADLPHARAERRGATARAGPAAADRPRPAQDARARLDLGRERRRGGRARVGARRRTPAAIDGVLVLGDLASASRHKPWVVPWSNGARAAAARLAAHGRGGGARRRSGADPGGSRASAQWARRALPLTVSEQGEVNRAGPARRCCCRSAASAARPPARGVSRERFTEVGRARAARGDRARRGRPARRGGETRAAVRRASRTAS